MNRARGHHAWWCCLAALFIVLGTAAGARGQEAEAAAIRGLLDRIERAVLAGDTAGYESLLAGSANRAAAATFLADEFRAGATRVVVQERERQHLPGTLPGDGYSLTVDAFIEYGDRARVATWQVDIRLVDTDSWRITGQNVISSIENIYRLSVTASRQYAARNFVVRGEDIELTLAEGSVFTIDTDQGTTGLVLLGRGDVHFHPAPRTEIEQVKIFAGAESLTTRFDAVYVRLGTLSGHADMTTLVERQVDPRDLRRAEQIFREESVKSFSVDLADLTRDTWSLLPGEGDLLAEIRTRRFDTLTYVRSTVEPEDISFFDRRRQRNIAVYASKEKIESRGRFYNEDDLAPIDVLDYDIHVNFIPERQWIDAQATMKFRVVAPSIGQLTIKLADSLVVRSVSSNVFGRLFTLRVMNQNTLLVNLPSMLLQDAEMSLRVEYGGRLEPQGTERETIAVSQDPAVPAIDFDDAFLPKAEPNYLYSNRSFWYPQPSITDYATATIEIAVSAPYAVVASGQPTSSSPEEISGEAGRPRRVYSFTAERPLRYLSFLVSRFTLADQWTVAFDKPDTDRRADGVALDLDDAYYTKLDLTVQSNPRQARRARDLAERAVDVVQFYESVIGDAPYRSLTVALLESTLPGGHSPAYFAAVNQPMSITGITWRNDPAAFAGYPEFFLAHEVAHQWWGQAVGWRNYHEQWLSEGFAQYFAALYAQRVRGDATFASVMRQMMRWAADQSAQGPVYLGYRIGHIKGDGRAFRAVVYNKGAVVLHMLRTLVGDEAFFAGVRRFYTESRFKKAGTDDLRLALEAESGRSLERFFERWIYNSALPRVSFGVRVEGQEAVLRFEQLGETFDMPVTVTLQFAEGRTTVTVPLTETVVEARVPMRGALRLAEIDRDSNALLTVVKN